MPWIPEQIFLAVFLLVILLTFSLYMLWKPLGKNNEDVSLRAGTTRLKLLLQNCFLLNWSVKKASTLFNVFRLPVSPKGISTTAVAYPATRESPCQLMMMQNERNRLSSFYGILPADLPGRSIVLAGNGFYFDRQHNSVLCFSCMAMYPEHYSCCRRVEDNEPFSSPPALSPADGPEDPSELNVSIRSPRGPGRETITDNDTVCEYQDLATAPSVSSATQDTLLGNDDAKREPEAEGKHTDTPSTTRPLDLRLRLHQPGAGGKVFESSYVSPEQSSARQRGTCRSCGLGAATATFLPCRHCVLCWTCAAGQEVCVVCQVVHV